MIGYIYIIGDGNSFKIGATTGKPERRLRTIQLSSPVQMSVALAFQSNDVFETEKNLHNLFIEKRIMGEWFALNDDDLLILQDEFGARGFLINTVDGDSVAQWSMEAPNLLNMNRKIIEHQCPICHEKFMGIKIAKYCSNRCQQAAKYARKTGKTPQRGD